MDVSSMGTPRRPPYCCIIFNRCRIGFADPAQRKANPMHNAPVLVTGATGKTGRRIVRILAERGFAVRQGARGAPIPFDWARADTWGPALDGVRAAYIAYFPDLALPGAQETIRAFADAARDAGVGRLVLLSGRGERHAEACEAIVRESGLDHSLVRCAWFAQNFSEGYLRDPVLDGVVALPAGDVREPIVDVDDIAEVAAACLTENRHSGKLYEITGPHLLGFADAARAIASASGRPVKYQPITLEQFHTAMTEIGGAFIADVFTEICRETLDGRNAWVGDGVRRALGRSPRSFDAFCRTAAAEGAWHSPALTGAAPTNATG
jgi:uncharacterized protein YbjT (DUF2867 family)